MTTPIDNTLDVFLVVGDSNAVGQGDHTLSPTVQPGTAIQYSAAGTISDANDPTLSAVNVSHNANTGSPWPTFGNAYYRGTGRKVGFVLTGVAGSTQSAAADFGVGEGNWDTTGTNYTSAIAAFNAAMTAFAANGYATSFRGVIVDLGANDAARIDAGVIVLSQYHTAFTAMLTRLRTTFSNPELPIYLVQTGTNISAPDTGYAQVRGDQVSGIASDPHTSIMFFNRFDFLARGMMNFGAHPTQAGYNEEGAVLAANIIVGQIESAFQRNGLDLYWSQGRVAIGYPVATAPFTVNPNTAAPGTHATATPPLAPLNPTTAHFVGLSGGLGVIVNDSYGGPSGLIARAIGGTVAAPAATSSGTSLLLLSAQGYTGSAFTAAVNGYFQIAATETFTPTANGTRAEVGTTKSTTTTRTPVMGWENDGGVTVPPSVTGGSKGPGTINLSAGIYALNSSLRPQTFASLPAASPRLLGTTACVSDSTTAKWGAAVTGGGSHGVIAFCNGTNWTVFAA